MKLGRFSNIFQLVCVDMTKQYAPIVLFVYNRLWHTQKTIEALEKNNCAIESELFIYSDAAKNSDSYEQVEVVRTYIKTI